MPHIITEPCVGTCEKACVDECPVDCIHPSEGFEDPEGKQLYINPEECIDCESCVAVCPVEAIFADEDLPEKWEKYAQINADYFKKEAAA